MDPTATRPFLMSLLSSFAFLGQVVGDGHVELVDGTAAEVGAGAGERLEVDQRSSAFLLPEKVPVDARVGQVVAGDILQLADDGARVDPVLVGVLADVHRQLAAAGAEGEEALVAVEGGQRVHHGRLLRGHDRREDPQQLADHRDDLRLRGNVRLADHEAHLAAYTAVAPHTHTFELVEQHPQAGAEVELADVDDDVNHIGAVNKPLVDVIVDGLLVGRLRRQQSPPPPLLYLLENVDGQSVGIDVLVDELLAEALQTAEGVVGAQFGCTEPGVVVAVRENGELAT
ncbi:hypothetical protein TYRP_009257 [Tyrophagus putrescentiae]|nr:hypothetical protein TYRP_009257 [Tyrophagus putrescentiae]